MFSLCAGPVQALAEGAGVERPAEFVGSWHTLMNESIISAAEGDTTAIARAWQMAD